MPHMRISFKWIRNVKNETMVILYKNINNFLYNMGTGKEFLTMIQNPDAIMKKTIYLTI